MKKLFISMYHYTRNLKNSRYSRIKGLDSSYFEQQIEFMKMNFNIVSMEQVIEASKGNLNLPENALLLTFDDGYIDNYTVAFPILEKYGVQGSFFIPGKTFSEHELLDVNKIHYLLACADIKSLVRDLEKEMEFYRGIEYTYDSTENLYREYAIPNRFDDGDTIFVKRMLQTVLPEDIRKKISSKLFKEYVGISEKQLANELYMNEDQIRVMRKHGMYIGIHGYDHYWLGDLNEEKMKNDIQKAVECLDEFIDSKQWVMNYPYGSYNQSVLEYVKNKGACLGVTTEVRVADLENDSMLTLPRLDCNDFPPISQNYKKY